MRFIDIDIDGDYDYLLRNVKRRGLPTLRTTIRAIDP